MKQKALFYILSFTWGLPMTLIGLIVALVLICTGHKPKKWGGCWYFNVGGSWGGLELGAFFLTDGIDNKHVKNHEFGHAIQNCVLGPLMPFLVSIPSAIRYWYRTIRENLGLRNETAYDAIWFEGSATRLGNGYISKWNSLGE